MRQSTGSHCNLQTHSTSNTVNNHRHSHHLPSGSTGIVASTMSPQHTTSLAANNRRNFRVVVASSPANHISNRNITPQTTLSSDHQVSSQSIPAEANSTTTSAGNKENTSSTNVRWVTRELAALDFLLNIPLELEPKIVQEGWCKLQLQYIQQSHHDDEATLKSDTESQTGRNIEDEIVRGTSNVRFISPSPKGTWWEKWINKDDINSQQQEGRDGGGTNNNGILEDPTRDDINNDRSMKANVLASSMFYAPGGRRLDGDDAIYIQIPFDAYTTVLKSTMQKDIAKQAAVRQWEMQTAHGVISSQQQQQYLRKTTGSSKQEDQTPKSQPPLLDGRIFFSSNNSYPVSVFSMIRYEPKREEAAFRRRKLEAIGGGGSQFAMPIRDWRGISFRALLPRRVEKTDKKFNRFLNKGSKKVISRNEKTKTTTIDMSDQSALSSAASSTSSSSDNDSTTDGYVPGLLDDPDMVQGRHRNVMIGDHVTGPIVASTIQFVEPALLKAELNKQFRERFDGWEPPKAARKYIGARVVNGNYALMDPTDGDGNNSYNPGSANNSIADDQSSIERKPSSRPKRRPRQQSVTSIESANDSSTTGGAGNALVLPKEKTIRMPPSLTLSKIRSIKAQALKASVAANLEISTVALACVYFERLCLDCRVDKSNRRLAFAACLLIAAKLNESNVGLVMKPNNKTSICEQSDESGSDDDNNKGVRRRKVKLLQALIRPTKRSNTIFASLLQFFAQDWSLSLKQLFDAEWGVFAALGFSLTSNPSHVAFHYKRLMKALEKNPIDYLGREMYQQWQDVIADEDDRRMKRERRNEARRKRNDEQILNMHIEIENEVLRRKEARAQQKTNDTDAGAASDDGSKRQDNVIISKNDLRHESPVKAVTLTLQPYISLQNVLETNSTIANRNIKSAERVNARKALSGMGFLHRFAMRRSASHERLNIPSDVPPASQSMTRLMKRVSFDEEVGGSNANAASPISRLRPSPSLPELVNFNGDLGVIAIDIPPLPDLNVRPKDRHSDSMVLK